MDRFSRRTVKVTKEHNEECRRLLRLMGIPVVVVCAIHHSIKTDLHIILGSFRSRGSVCRISARREGDTYTSHTTLQGFISAQVYAAGSEDMDTLTFSAPILMRHLTFSEAKKQPISEINLKAALDGLDMDMSQVCLSLHIFSLYVLLISHSSWSYAYSWDVIISIPLKV